MNFKEEDLSLLLKAVKFSADKHKTQRRKGAEGSPYINHPIDVAETLWKLGGVRDLSVIVAAILHDTVEDTDTTLSEIEEYFGPVVRSLVQEVTDDKTLPKPERKRLQIEHAPHLSTGAKRIKLADKISNIKDAGPSLVPASAPLRYGRISRQGLTSELLCIRERRTVFRSNESARCQSSRLDGSGPALLRACRVQKG